MCRLSIIMSSFKRKRVCLTVDDKIKILHDVKSGASYSVIEERYGVGRSTISDIKKNESQIMSFKRRAFDEGLPTSAKTMKVGEDERLDQSVYLWFRQQREKGGPSLDQCCRLKPNSSIHCFTLTKLVSHFMQAQDGNGDFRNVTVFVC